MKKRGSGILLHITSLPSPFGIGDMGSGAYKFADFLAESGQSYWQILPLNPTGAYFGNSPYSILSSIAGNVLLISPEFLIRDGFLTQADLLQLPAVSQDRVDYNTVITYKKQLLSKTYESFKKSGNKDEFNNFCKKYSNWLDDYALFIVLKEHFQGKVWSEWQTELRDRHPSSLQTIKSQLGDKVEKEKFLQYLFFNQWVSLKQYCNQKGIQIIGDIPIYVNYDSVDVWTNPEIFKLDKEKKPLFVAGVPPDYFSQTGQLWGNPVYLWDMLKKTGYAWWVRRLQHNLNLFDIVRIDHFRGLVAYWEVPAGEKTAINGKWVEVPVKDLFNTLLQGSSDLPIIAEDLGIITDDVKEIMEYYGFPGMKVLLFAFGDDLAKNPYVPHNHIKNCLVYTGTHDNNTARGWYEREATWDDKRRLSTYLGREIPSSDIHWELIRTAMMSVANMVIFPMQDILGLGGEARMNHPGTMENNWEWRLLPEHLTPWLANKLLEMSRIYGRLLKSV